MAVPDLTKIDLYLLSGGNNFYFGRYKDGPSSYFYLNKNDDGWEIVPFGTSLWDTLDQDAWFGHDIDEWYGERSTHNPPPDWLPPVPTVEELRNVKSVKWEDNFKAKTPMKADKFPNLKKHFEENTIREKKLYFALKEDTYESRLGDGIFRYLCKVSFSREEIETYIASFHNDDDEELGLKGFFKEHTIKYEDGIFTIPDFLPETFEHYDEEELIKIADEILNAGSIKYYEKKDDKEIIYAVENIDNYYKLNQKTLDWEYLPAVTEFDITGFWEYSESEFGLKVGYAPGLKE